MTADAKHALQELDKAAALANELQAEMRRRYALHDELVYALQQARWTYLSMLPSSDLYKSTLHGRQVVDAALAKAKGPK
jgi:hypothetical protein